MSLIDEVYAAGGIPFVRHREMQVLRKLMQGATSAQWAGRSEERR